MKRMVSYRSLTGVIVGLYIILATVYSLSIPVWEAPDELGHFAYVRHLRQTRTLPIQGQHAAGEAHQPPLYYAVAAFVSLPADVASPVGRYRPNPDFMWRTNGGSDVNINFQGTAQTIPFQGQALALHLARLASVIMGAATVYLIIQLGVFMFPQQPEPGLLAGGLTALTPQFLFITGVLNNDNLLILCTTGAIRQTVQAIKQPEQRRQWVYVGAWLAAAVLTKLTAVAVVALVGIVICYVSWRRQSKALFLQASLIIGSMLLVLTGWWFYRNQMLYGDPLGNAVYEQLFASNLRLTPLRWSDVCELFSVQFRSFWAVFGWMNVPGPPWYFDIIRALLFLTGLGWVRLLVRPTLNKRQWQIIGFLGLAVILQEATILYLITRCNASCYQGRYLFPVIGAIMLWIAVGFSGLMPLPWRSYLSGFLGVAFATMAIWMLFAVIRPAYSLTPEPGRRLWFVPEKVEASFGEQFVLHGYSQENNETSLRFQLYWQAVTEPDFDYSTFLHLVDASGQLVAQADVGLGQVIGYLPTSWAGGDMVMETYEIELPDGLPAGTYQIRAGVYNWITGERLFVHADAEPVGDFIVLDEVTVP